ncbi:MAG: hypothetical protein ACOC97_00680 [Myxococcota bacterium]
MSRWRSLAGVAALLGGSVAVGVGWSLDEAQAVHSSLAALAWATTTALGALFWLMLGIVTRTSWFVVLRRTAEGFVASLPLLALLFVPLLFALDVLYEWVPGGHGMSHHAREAVEKKRVYLNAPFFVGRSAFYWVFFVALGGTLLAWSLAADGARAGERIRRMRGLSAPGFFALSVVGTFAATDWLMTLDPAWYSTMFGGYVLMGGFVSAGGLLALTAHLSQRAGRLEPFNAEHRQALGTVVFATVCAWAWFAFAQFYLIWIANLPEEIRWYLDRTRGGWTWLGVGYVIARFPIPFALLLFKPIKRHGVALAAIGAWLALAHYANMAWIVLPRLHPEQVTLSWMDAAAWLTAAGALATGHAYWTSVAPTVPVTDPRYAAALEYQGT